MTSSDNNDIAYATSALSSDGPTFYRRGTRDRKESNRDYHRKESFENSKHMRYHTPHDFLLFLTWSIKNRERTETKETKNEIHNFSRVIFRITIISKFPLILRRKSENSFHSPFRLLLPTTTPIPSSTDSLSNELDLQSTFEITFHHSSLQLSFLLPKNSQQSKKLNSFHLS